MPGVSLLVFFIVPKPAHPVNNVHEIKIKLIVLTHLPSLRFPQNKKGASIFKSLTQRLSKSERPPAPNAHEVRRDTVFSS